jgi:alpha-soluble NSF attachment protein
LQDLTDAVEAGDVDAFTAVVAEFDSLSRLDSWKTTMLVRVKRKIQSRAEVEEEDLT